MLPVVDAVVLARYSQGVVLVVASLGPLWNTTKQMGQEGLFDVYVVDGRGWLVAHSDPSRLQGNLDVTVISDGYHTRAEVYKTAPR